MDFNKLGPLPTLHPRYEAVRNAKIELESFLIDYAKRHSLTASEQLMLLGEATYRLGQLCVSGERRRKDGGDGPEQHVSVP